MFICKNKNKIRDFYKHFWILLIFFNKNEGVRFARSGTARQEGERIHIQRIQANCQTATLDTRYC